MATLTPPAKKPPAPRRPASDERHWAERLAQSGYFLGAVLFHLILFLLLATWVIFKPLPPPADEFEKTYIAPSTAPPPPPAQETPQVPTQTLTTPDTVITSAANVAPAFTVPLPDLSTALSPDKIAKVLPTTIKTPSNLPSRLPAIQQMEEQNWGRSLNNIRESEGDPHNVVATFPVYVASYANGDWDCNLVRDPNGNIVAGSMPDLVAKINEWSHGSMKGHVEPKPLAIGSPDLLAKKPPFIFFTGHKDFVLTEQEVTNLREYLNDGGAIWGDNALAGKGSRFDLAFKKQMRRVIPDLDKEWEDMAMTSDLFRKSWFVMDKLPTGMNYYAEPIQHIDIDGKLAIVYTPNDYSDMLFMQILPGDTAMGFTHPTLTQPLYTNYMFAHNAKIFYRNFELDSCLDAYRLGMNILAHLLVRFDRDLMLAPP